MCPKKCVTPHSGSVADRTNFLAHSKQLTCKKRLKVEGGSSPIRPGSYRVQRTDLSYFCGEVRNTWCFTRQGVHVFIFGNACMSRGPNKLDGLNVSNNFVDFMAQEFDNTFGVNIRTL
ncbi:hypothetical protein AVEN_44177-1 [Araneus ventricosus]|uniref:Uncharacterized protein n=1 Tax=Araneus ventricosus TaxID=182803 RepID=A0A4Y2C8Y2_ARAVE|nr:hypothetical protein AVEN_44177-1 [Araneus ventricosus]